jgi:hypothetical protein
MRLDPAGTGRKRQKVVSNTFELTFAGRLSAGRS